MKWLIVLTVIFFQFQSLLADEFSSNYWVGVVRKVHGNARIGERVLSKEDRVYRNEVIKTAEKSLAVIELMDKTEVKLGPESEFRVDKWIYYNDHDRNTVMSILKGQIRAHVKSKTKYEEQVEFKTKNISMGIRGTEFLVNVVEKLDEEVTQVALIEGLIHIHSNTNLSDRFIYPGDEILAINDENGNRVENKKIDIEKFKINQDEFLPVFAKDKNSKSELKVKLEDNFNTIQSKPWKNVLEELNRARARN